MACKLLSNDSFSLGKLSKPGCQILAALSHSCDRFSTIKTFLLIALAAALLHHIQKPFSLLMNHDFTDAIYHREIRAGHLVFSETSIASTSPELAAR